MFLDPFFFCDIATLKQISPLQTQVVKCVARNCDGCVKFVLKLCYRQHILTDCNKCKRLSARAIDYMRRVHCSDGTAGDRGAGQCCVTVVLQTTLCNTDCSKCKRFRGDRGAGQRPLMVLLSQLQQFTFAQFTIENSQIWNTDWKMLVDSLNWQFTAIQVLPMLFTTKVSMQFKATISNIKI